MAIRRICATRGTSARRRGVDRNQTEMNRLYVIESTPTLTGANADHRFTVKPSEMLKAVMAIASRVGVGGFQRTVRPAASTLSRAIFSNIVMVRLCLPATMRRL